jgi:hypothetical protein
MEDRDAGPFHRERVSDLTSSVGRVIVDDEYVSLGHGSQDGLRDRPKIVFFVVCR